MKNRDMTRAQLSAVLVSWAETFDDADANEYPRPAGGGGGNPSLPAECDPGARIRALAGRVRRGALKRGDMAELVFQIGQILEDEERTESYAGENGGLRQVYQNGALKIMGVK